MRSRALALLAALGALALAPAAPAQEGAEEAPASDGQILQAPVAGGRPVVVSVGVFLMHVNEINEVEQKVSTDGYVELRWRDPRVAFDSLAAGLSVKTYLDEEVTRRLGSQLWWPNPDFINAEGDPELDRHIMQVEADGDVSLSAHFSATLLSTLDLRQFPYDAQRVRIEISPYSDTLQDVRFVVNHAASGHNPALERIEWAVRSDTAVVDVADYSELGTLWGRYSRYTFELEVDRQSGFYHWKIFLPLLLIVASSWSVFWIRDLASELAVAFTIMLTIVAFNLTIADSLPRVPYLTFMDAVLTASFVFVFLSLVVIVLTSVLESREHGERATRLRRVSRWAFPVGTVGTVAALALAML